MSEFHAFYQLGLEHILDWQGYDHIVFVIALCAVYQIEDIKRVLILVTAFTLGHSVTLALATLQIVSVNSELVEFLIPVTIFLTAVSNFFRPERIDGSGLSRNYLLAAMFGLVHGLGFSNYLRSLLGKDESIVTQLLAFNVGLEVGQLIIVVVLLALAFVAVSLLGVARRDWRLVVSGITAGMALVLILDSDLLN